MSFELCLRELPIKLALAEFDLMKILGHRLTVRLFSVGLEARGDGCVAQLEPSGLHKHLSMPWVPFVFDAGFVNTDHTVEHAHFPVAVVGFPSRPLTPTSQT